MVPAAALQSGQQQSQYVFVVKDDSTVDVRRVTVKRTQGGETIIADGLKAGESVVVDGTPRLVAGAKVEVRRPGRPGDASPQRGPGSPRGPRHRERLRREQKSATRREREANHARTRDRSGERHRTGDVSASGARWARRAARRRGSPPSMSAPSQALDALVDELRTLGAEVVALHGDMGSVDAPAAS